MTGRAVVFGRGLPPKAHLAGFFPGYEFGGRRPPAAVLVRSEEPRRSDAEALARRHDIPCRQIDDGLVRSIGPASSGAPSVSLLVDGAATLDRLALDAAWQTPELLAKAAGLMAFKRAERLGRVNAGRDPLPLLGGATGRPRILVADRSSDETIFGRPSAGAADYAAMFRAARAAHPGAQLIVKREPGAPAGLSREDLALADMVIAEDVDVVALVEHVDHVYTVAGLIGLEAVLCGRPVETFGKPFYAAFGPSPEVLFAAAYLLAPRYVDPLTAEPCDAGHAFERLVAMKRHAHRVAGRWTGLNIPPVKQPVIRAFLEGPCSTFKTGGRRDPKTRLAAWAARPNAAVRRARTQSPERVVNIEDGFLRSVGLGSSFEPAASLVFDSRGIHYDPRRASDLEHLLNNTDFDEAMLGRAGDLRRRIVALRLSKYNLAAPAGKTFAAPHGRRLILVPGQVENDASVRTGGAGLDNLELLERVRRTAPEAFIVYKPHPDVIAGNRPGAVATTAGRNLADLVLGNVDIVACIETADEVHTLTSLTGFEALLRGKSVTTYGWPFYAGWGLTRDLGPAPGPSRRSIELDALVAGALILYPLYLDPISRLPCDAEAFVERLEARRSGSGGGATRPRLGMAGRYAQGLRQIMATRRPTPY